MDSRKPRDGKYIEQIGRYDARQDPSLIEINNERAVEWLQQGAQPTDRAKKLLEIEERGVAQLDAAGPRGREEAEEVTEAVEVEEAVAAVEAADDDTIEITTIEDTDATETDEA